MRSRGFLLSLALIILVLPLVYLVWFYLDVAQTGVDDRVSAIRCDELHYYVEDVKKDMERSVSVFGRRAALDATNYVLVNDEYFDDYEFNCTSACRVDCDRFIRPEKGSSAAIAELVVCGTLHGVTDPLMENNTLMDWTDKMIADGVRMNFDVNITPYAIYVVSRDAFHFSVIVDNKMSVSDRSGMCFFQENIIRVKSNSSIEGLEDPIYYLNTGEIKRYYPCESDYLMPVKKAACGIKGSGFAEGPLVYYSSIVPLLSQYNSYCAGALPNPPGTAEVEGSILYVDMQGYAACSSCPEPAAALIPACLDNSSPRHFAGVASIYQDWLSEDPAVGDVTIPYVAETGNMTRDPFCNACHQYNVSEGDQVFLVNNESCNRYFVLFAEEDLNISCYHTSRIGTGDYAKDCTTDISDGPSFFDRLEGRVNLSTEYLNDSIEYFNEPNIGLESMINLSLLRYKHDAEGYDIQVNESFSWVDYMYWSNTSGCRVEGYLPFGDDVFIVDCPHSHAYDLVSECAEFFECPVCGDGECTLNEGPISCPPDCA